MLITCTNKICMQMSNAQLDKDTMEVICEECKKPIDGVTEHMKRLLASSGQIIRDEARKAFSMACNNCKANREVVLNSDNDTVCRICTKPITVHASMRLAIEAAGVKLQAQTKKKRKKRAKNPANKKKTKS